MEILLFITSSVMIYYNIITEQLMVNIIIIMTKWYFLPLLMKNALRLVQNLVQKVFGVGVGQLRESLPECVNLTVLRV